MFSRIVAFFKGLRQFRLYGIKVNVCFAVVQADCTVLLSGQRVTNLFNIIFPQFKMATPTGRTGIEIAFADLPGLHQPVGQIGFGAEAVCAALSKPCALFLPDFPEGLFTVSRGQMGIPEAGKVLEGGKQHITQQIASVF